MTTKPRAIEITSALRTRKTIAIAWTQGEGSFDLDERDNPLPAFAKAFDALGLLVPVILGVGEEWMENLRVIGIKMGDQGGAASVQLVCSKGLADAAKAFKFTTPARLLKHPADPGTYTPPLSEEHAALVWEAVEQAKNYVKGDRAQGQIAFEGDDDEEGGDGGEESEAERLKREAAELPLVVDIVAGEVKARKKRGGKKAAA